MTNPIVSVFTPTYNRAYKIGKLYYSLQKQTNKRFEWVVVDDGSTDNTEELINNWIKDQKIPIHFCKQKNGGKHRAINKGLEVTRGKLFFIVDSDDWLYENAIERIIHHYDAVKNNPVFCGVSGLKVFEDGCQVGGEKDFGILDCNALDFRYKHQIKGDMAEVFVTDILRQYRFPEITEETFCPEALVWNRIAKKYKLRYFYEKIYFCEYLPDGLSAKITKLRIKNPIASCLHYAELSQSQIPFIQKIKAIINYWRFSFWLHEDWSLKMKIRQIRLLSLLLYPIGFIFYKIDLKNNC